MSARSLAALGDYHFSAPSMSDRGTPSARRWTFSRPRRTAGIRSPSRSSVIFTSVLRQLSADSEAEALQREALDLARQVLGPRSMVAANLLNNVATTQCIAGRHREAERLFRAAFEEHRELVGETHWRTRNVARNVGRTLALQGRYAEALPWMDRAIPLPGVGHNPSGIVAQRAEILFRLGRRAEALADVKAAVSSLETLREPAAAMQLAAARVIWGRLLTESGRPRDAEPHLQAAVAWLDRQGGDEARRAEASCELARARLQESGQPADWQRLRQCLPIYRAWGLAERQVVQALERLRPGS